MIYKLQVSALYNIDHYCTILNKSRWLRLHDIQAAGEGIMKQTITAKCTMHSRAESQSRDLQVYYLIQWKLHNNWNFKKIYRTPNMPYSYYWYESLTWHNPVEVTIFHFLNTEKQMYIISHAILTVHVQTRSNSSYYMANITATASVPISIFASAV